MPRAPRAASTSSAPSRRATAKPSANPARPSRSLPSRRRRAGGSKELGGVVEGVGEDGGDEAGLFVGGAEGEADDERLVEGRAVDAEVREREEGGGGGDGARRRRARAEGTLQHV